LHYCHAITACGIAFESYQRKKKEEKLGEDGGQHLLQAVL